MNQVTYPVHERFFAFQGEGVHMGRRSFFIRTYGCPVHCPWCDSAGTWHKDYTPKGINRMTVDELVEEAVASKAEFVVLTGGEPTVHDLNPLCLELMEAGLDVHLETCGAFEYDREAFDWVTISPKWAKLPLRQNLQTANELKLIVEHPTVIKAWVDKLAEIGGAADDEDMVEALVDLLPNQAPIWLHPEWSQRESQEILQNVANWVKEEGDPFRAGWQLHKLYSVDALDSRAKGLVPLGGNPELGY